MDNFKNTDFNALARSQTSIQMKMRLLALAHFQDGKSRTQISQFLKVSRTSVNKWVHVYLTEGLAGLQEKPRTGSPTFISTKQRAQLADYIEKRASSAQGGRLTGAHIHTYLVQYAQAEV
ncbi:transposase and inactivated derivative [Shewanella benthica KT99]|uniref:Transposase and inactivated derivative n=1 Tax=Shewanella benthica KT99 TaxID=314608 RepID=A9DGQ0_9GAMM|nr:transposase and inactivated derivative [Shewanella benthica KT99]